MNHLNHVNHLCRESVVGKWCIQRFVLVTRNNLLLLGSAPLGSKAN
jgi:hypothetical protein